MSTNELQKVLGACLLETVPDPVFVVSPQGDFLAANEAASRFLDVSSKQVVGRPLGELFPPELADWALDVTRTVAATGEPVSEERLTPLRGARAVFHYTVRRLEGGDGLPLGVVFVARDVTAQAELQGRYSELYEWATDALFALDSRGRLSIVNRQAELLSGYRRDEVESLHFSQIVPPEEVDRLQGYFEARLRGGDAPTEYELRYLHASGEQRWAEVRISREPSPGGFFQASVRDVTPRKRLEAMRSEFLHMVSHGVKTPLTIIHGYASALASGRFGALPADLQGPIAAIDQAADRVRRLMEQFLLAERLDINEETSTEPGPAAEILRESVGSLLGDAEGRGICLVADLERCGGAEVADREGLRCVVENFLSNAFKFTPEGGTVTVRGAVEDASLRLDVEDTGSGIPADQLGKVFERFYRIASPAENWGSGLGLYIVRRWVERMGGKVEVASCLDRGTCFTVRIPLRGA